MSVLSIHSITKRYGSLTAVDQLSLEIPKGSVYGILGPNGSGKTTTLGMVLGVTHPTSGSFSWFGEPPVASQRQRIGSILEQPNFYPYLSAVKNLQIACLIKKVPFTDIDRVLILTGLAERKKSKVSTYSLGMKQRLAVSMALLGDPDVLVLDEPTNGLDPQGIAEMRRLITDLGSEGKTILLASHILDEVEKTCDHVAILKKGKLLAAGSVAEIIKADDTLVVKAENMELLELLLGSCPMVKNVKKRNKHLEANLVESGTSAAVNQYLFEKGMVLSEMYVEKKSLESQFLEIVR